MKILIVCSATSGKISPFIIEQADAIAENGIQIDYFTITQKGIRGYLKSKKNLINKIKTYQPDIIHAHYGLSGLLANLQRKVPVITTYHGSDINSLSVRWLSNLSIKFSKHNIFVSEKTIALTGVKRKYSLIPCGINDALFSPMDKSKARNDLGFKQETNYVLFAGAFNNKVKNAELAIEAIKRVRDGDIELIELKRYKRDEVVLLMSVVDICLLTSHTEGSPQFVKEAMACNCPVVATDVGDIKWLFGEEPGHFLTSFEADDVADKIKAALDYSEKHGRTNGRQRIIELGLDSETVAQRIIKLYIEVCGN